MARNRTRTRELFQRARQVFPYGVNSNFRYWGDDETNIFVRGEKGYVYDVDENRYIDYRLAFGPIILGHGYAPVVERVAQAIKDGTVFAATHPLEISVGERVKRMTGMDKVRFANSGTEATMHALRIARGFTARDVVVKFEGCYHGFYDYMLWSTAMAPRGALGAERSPIPVPSGSGIPRIIGDLVIVLPYNDFDALERTVKARWGEIAAIIVEPGMGNAASIMPAEGWLQHIRKLCTEYGIVMILDEVKTGFRVARGGAQEYFGVRADLTTYAKSIANGFPLAAIGGREEVMSVVGPGSVAHGGTYVGNMAGAAAAEATLEILEKQDILGVIAKRGQKLMAGLGRILTEAGIAHAVVGFPQMPGFVVGFEGTPRNYRDCLAGDGHLYEHIIMEMIERGAIAEADFREPWFLCYEHSDADIDETLNIFADAVKAAKKVP